MSLKRTSVSKEEFLHAIPGSYGTLQPIEKLLYCTRQALRDCMRKYPELEQELKDEAEREFDKALISTFEDAKTGDERVRCKARDQIFKAFGKDRGFGDQQDNSGDGKIQLFLHTSNVRLSVSDWQKQAAVFSEQRDREVDKQMKELGIE